MNSPEDKGLKNIPEGAATRKPQTIGKKFSNFFFDGMTVGDVMKGFVEKRLFPQIKDGFYNAASGLVDSFFYPDRAPRASGSRSSGGSRTQYESFGRPGGMSHSTNYRITHEFDDIEFKTKEAADIALENLYILLEQYGKVTVDEYYEAAGVSSNGFSDCNYGWYDLTGCYVTRRNGAWRLIMPNAVELNRKK